MKSKSNRASSPEHPLARVEQALSADAPSAEQLGDAREALLEIAASAEEASRHDLAACATLLAGVLEIASCTGDATEGTTGSHEAVDFAKGCCGALRNSLEGDEEDATALETIQKEARDKWGEYLDLVSTHATNAVGLSADWDGDSSKADESPGDAGADAPFDAPAEVDVGALLSTLESFAAAPPDYRSAPPPRDRVPVARPSSQPAEASQQATGRSAPGRFAASPPPPDRVEIDEELLGAYLDDAGKCLASMEECLLAFEENSGDREALRQFCRELHTLKGASASVGLHSLAHYLHELEDYVQACCNLDEPVQSIVGVTHTQADYVEACCNRTATIDVETLLQGIDAVHNQVQILTGGVPDRQGEAASAARDSRRRIGEAPTLTHDAVTSRSDEFVRVEASRLDRLMDLLAGLVMLRNRRETGVGQLKQLHSELGRYVGRLRTFDDRVASFAKASRVSHAAAVPLDPSPAEGYRTTSLAELCSDMSELGRSLREVFEPLSEDNLAVSRLIGQFRQELMELRRLPVAGLFRRLHRGARDAARKEGKQVHLELVGENVGLERSLQERLYEPLLHLVRNAVSHGIEVPTRRMAAGKPPVGTMTLRAHSDSSTLVFEVRDDGRGLDYEAVERRGRELGLLPAGPASRDQLAKLIFYPGFSTRREVSEISGRGVGMDVVTQVVDRMRGQVDVESTPGNGTTVRLRIPLSSGIEHAMVVRVDGQLFALPMQHVHGANSTLLRKGGGPTSDTQAEPIAATGAHRDQLQVIRLRALLGLQRSAAPAEEQVLIVGCKRSSARSLERKGRVGGRAESRFALVVDAVVGAEEVVVRALPPLLRSHRLFAGVTLSGDGEPVLLFDVPHLLDQQRGGPAHDAAAQTRDIERDAAARRANQRVLVVDDSLSTRKSLCQLLKRAGLTAVEAADGLDALDVLRTNTFAAVLTDLEMPRLGGMELLAEIKRGRRTSHLPVIVITSRSDEETRSRAKSLGADGFVTKPVGTSAIAEILATLDPHFCREMGVAAAAPRATKRPELLAGAPIA